VQNYVVTRWLSLEGYVSRVLQWWSALVQYFEEDVGRYFKEYMKNKNDVKKERSKLTQ